MPKFLTFIQIDINLTDPKREMHSLQQFKDSEGMINLIKISKKMIEGVIFTLKRCQLNLSCSPDATFIRLLMPILEVLRKHRPVLLCSNWLGDCRSFLHNRFFRLLWILSNTVVWIS